MAREHMGARDARLRSEKRKEKTLKDFLFLWDVALVSEDVSIT